MTIANYSQLQTAIENFIDDSSITDRIIEFITLAEGRINRRLRDLQQQTTATATYGTSSSNRNLALPSGFVEMISLAIKKSTETDYNYETLLYRPPERLLDHYLDTAGKPGYYTVRNQIEFNRDADLDYTIRMGYIKKLDIATDLTNWLLTDYPDVYLYGALSEAGTFLFEDERVPLWRNLFKEGLREVNEVAERMRDEGEMDVTELKRMANRRYAYNILTDT